MKKLNLGEDQAIVMQVIEEAGEEEKENLVETLRFDRQQLLNILQNLHHKGLIVIRNNGYGSFAQLSSKGNKIAETIWPELPYLHYS